MGRGELPIKGRGDARLCMIAEHSTYLPSSPLVCRMPRRFTEESATIAIDLDETTVLDVIPCISFSCMVCVPLRSLEAKDSLMNDTKAPGGLDLIEWPLLVHEVFLLIYTESQNIIDCL